MNEIITLVIIMLVNAVVWHYAVRRYIAAVFGSTLTIILIFQLAVIGSVGYFDPFFMVALTVLAIAAVFIGLVIGIPFLLSRKKHEHGFE